MGSQDENAEFTAEGSASSVESTHKVVGAVAHEDVVTTRAHIELAFLRQEKLREGSTGWQFWFGVFVSSVLSALNASFGDIGKFITGEQIKAIVWFVSLVSGYLSFSRYRNSVANRDSLTCEKFIEELKSYQRDRKK